MILFLLFLTGLFFLIRHLIGSISIEDTAEPFRPRRVGKPNDVYEDERGYFRFAKNHQLVHRWVMEQKFGRRLRPEEVVHHKDRNKQNNASSNLWVFKNQAEHDEQHRRDAEKYGEWWSYNGSGRN